jgi:GNAT superfamily N-acetyltransferase
MWNASDGHLASLLKRGRLRASALVVNEMILGVLILCDEIHFSRLEHHLPLVYINYVATAPWNRRDSRGFGRLRGVGTSLMEWAAQYSREVGCEGRLGLHSLRSSDAFYDHLRFRNFGIDAAHRGMRYFERCDVHGAVYRRS